MYGVKKLPFPSKGRFESKNPHFLCREMGNFLTQSALFCGGGNGSFLTPQLSFPDFGDFDPARGALSQEYLAKRSPGVGTPKSLLFSADPAHLLGLLRHTPMGGISRGTVACVCADPQDCFSITVSAENIT